ncbi:MAG: nicotinate phosphoribosyltransferase [Acidobacteria bacterium]|nr:nicotinate phosphoribosyltransferase [Acidobacteriota bacterium]
MATTGGDALLTDFYQLTMAYGYFKSGLASTDAVFHLFFRENPFGGGFSIAAGLEPAVELLERFRFAPDDLAFLEGVRGNDDAPIFDREFLDLLAEMRFTCDVDAMPEGTAVFAQEPLLRVRGPIMQAQLVETPLLNAINFQTLVATRAARVVAAAGDRPVLEFGLRRAQGPDGGMSASRAAYIGGCSGTSNVLAAKRWGIPVRGTHAHSWVMAFGSELEAFEAWAEAMPNNCLFLVDTYDTLQGVRNAIEVGRRMRDRGQRMAGIRLDSGDLAYLSREARAMLDEAGFTDATIVGTNDLDEHIIESLGIQGAAIGLWAVGTRLVTAYEEPALGGVYKLAATRAPGADWVEKIKLSEQAVKTTTPGVLQVRRFHEHGAAVGDMIYDERHPPAGSPTIVDPADLTRRKTFAHAESSEELLVPVMRGGARVLELPAIDAIRARTAAQVSALHPGIRRFVNPHVYPVGLEKSLYDRKTQLILEAKGFAER